MYKPLSFTSDQQMVSLEVVSPRNGSVCISDKDFITTIPLSRLKKIVVFTVVNLCLKGKQQRLFWN